MLDELWVRSLHVTSLRRRQLHPEHADHVVFQASTIGALLDGAYEGDVSIGELSRHGDHGVGTFNALDGELIALDGEFLRADEAAVLHPVDASVLTPFAVVVWFTPEIELVLPAGNGLEGLTRAVAARVPDSEASFAIRIDGEFESVRVRSVPRQTPPYRPLTEVVADQSVFDLERVAGTLVGFRFPDRSAGIEAGGYHLHFVTDDRGRGGHVLDFQAGGEASVGIDRASDLRVELPPGIDLEAPSMDDELHAALNRVERAG